MSGNLYKGQLCVYCSTRKAVTGDHVFARGFFVLSARSYLPQVPTCNYCNNQKSRLEQYLTSVLPFGGRHADALTNLEELVPRRLQKNARLQRVLASGRGRVWNLEDGLYLRASTIPIDSQRVCNLFAYIARALVWFHWKVYFQLEHDCEVLMLTSYGKERFDTLLSMNAAQRVNEDIGDGTFQYIGAQAVDVPQLTIWRFQMYGGIVFAGDPEHPHLVSNEVGVLTGPRRLLPGLVKQP